MSLLFRTVSKTPLFNASRTLPPLQPLTRPFSATGLRLQTIQAPDPSYDPREKEIHLKLAKEFEPVKLRVEDISGSFHSLRCGFFVPGSKVSLVSIPGGCGAQYSISISSKRFNGLTQLKQHRLVNEVLKEELKQWHAIRLTTEGVKD